MHTISFVLYHTACDYYKSINTLKIEAVWPSEMVSLPQHYKVLQPRRPHDMKPKQQFNFILTYKCHLQSQHCRVTMNY